MKNKKTSEKSKGNSMLKNVGSVFAEWFKLYPSAFVLLPLYLILQISTPFVTTFIPSLAIRSISAGNVRNFVILVFIALICYWILNGSSSITGTFVQVQRTYTRVRYFTGLFTHKAVCTDYENIEPQKKQKLLGLVKKIKGALGNVHSLNKLIHRGAANAVLGKALRGLFLQTLNNIFPFLI